MDYIVKKYKDEKVPENEAYKIFIQIINGLFEVH